MDDSQVTISCNRRKDRENKRCLCNWIILAVLIAIFTFTIGLIIGAALSETFLAALAAIIVFAIIIAILIIIQIILIACCKEKNKRERCRD